MAGGLLSDPARPARSDMADILQFDSERTPIETTLGALREMAQLDNKYLAIPPALAEFILDNGFRHDDTAVMLAPGAAWIAGEQK